MAYVDWTDGWQENDEEGDVTVGANQITCAAGTQWRTLAIWVCKDFTANYWDFAFTHQFDVTLGDPGEDSPLVTFWMLSGAAAPHDLNLLVETDEDVVALYFYPDAMTLRVYEVGEVVGEEVSKDVTPTVTYYCTVTYNPTAGVGGVGQFMAVIRTGSHTGGVFDVLQADCTASIAWRWLYSINSFDTQGDPNNDLSMIVNNLSLETDGGSISRQPGRQGFTTRSAWRHRR
jgi:hypothetical protein